MLILLFASCANGKERIYIGSTPAGEVVKSFLGIPMTDSVDFIKWRIILGDKSYSLQCQFGIGKPNTDGFMNDGTKIEVSGELEKEKNYYIVRSSDKTLMMLELNNNLLHLLDKDKGLLIGNGGWSYTLNNEKPSNTYQVNMISKQNYLKDSIAFEGRTPCWNFAIVHPSPECIKLKWFVVLYADPKTHQPTRYHLNGNSRREGGKRGTWKITTGKGGRIIYQLSSDNENASIYLLKLDDNILVFTDAEGNLLVGDKNFSFTLNKR